MTVRNSTRCCKLCGEPINKSKHDRCRRCYLGQDKFNKEKERLKKVKRYRSIRNRKFICEMGYYDCELRGYCNGDC